MLGDATEGEGERVKEGVGKRGGGGDSFWRRSRVYFATLFTLNDGRVSKSQHLCQLQNDIWQQWLI